MNRKIRQLAVAMMAMYLALFIMLNYWQVDRTDELAAQATNTRALIRQYDKPRGPIVTADGVVVARSEQSFGATDVSYQRHYPAGDLFAQLVGYHTFGLGSTQLERKYSDVLTGDTTIQEIRALEEVLGRAGDTSGEVRLTLRNDLQNLAKFLLADREGSIVLMEPKTGAVRAMWSWPSFDPNAVSQPDYEAAHEYLGLIQQDERKPLLANTYQERYMPGSTFKVLTTGVALDDGTIDLQSEWDRISEWVPPQTDNPIQNYDGSQCGGELTEVFYRSCNIPFAQIALDLGPDAFGEGMQRWGIGEEIPFDVPGSAASTLGDFDNIDRRLPELAMRGFGQNEVQVVPLHMAMIASTVANGGEMMKPYVVDATLDHQGGVIDRTEPDVWKRPVSDRTAGILADLMRQVAEVGTASCCIALDNDIPVAAKTGTAQLNGPGEPERSHAWIMAYAPADDPQYAVAVMLKGTNAEISASTGGRLAGPIAKEMLDGTFEALGQPGATPTTEAP